MSREGRRRWAFWDAFIIGKQDNPMMKRLRLVQTPWFGVYVHFIYREDLDPVPHDHPWTFWRMVVRGGYDERFYADPAYLTLDVGDGEYDQRVSRFRPSLFRTTSAHRITRVDPGTVSVVLVGRKVRTWGFWQVQHYGPARAAVWVDYRDALGLRPTEGVV